jgi:hypothetical protein
MNAKEKELVVVNECTYNLVEGGQGGFGYINRHRLNAFYDVELARLGRKLANKTLEEKYGNNWNAIISAKGSKKARVVYAYKFKNDPEFKAKMTAGSEKGRLSALSDSSKKKRKDTMAAIGHQQGSKNSRFGTCWVTNGAINKQIKKEELDTYIAAGYYKGIVIQYNRP